MSDQRRPLVCCPAVIVRMAGFAFDLLSDLAFIESWDALRSGVDATSIFEEELGAKRTSLKTAYDAPRLREAVFIESPSALVGIQKLEGAERRRGWKQKRRERTAIAYLQRFAAKNDTNSICGPLGLAFIEDGEGPMAIRIVGELARRKTYFSMWAAERLLTVLAGRKGLSLPLRRNPMAADLDELMLWCRVRHDATTFFERRYAQAPRAPMDAVWSAMTEPRTPEGLDGEIVEAMLEAGVLVAEPQLPSGLFDPLQRVAELIGPSPEIEEVKERVRRFADGGLGTRVAVSEDLEAFFESVVVQSARRGGGRVYSDRGLLHEDCFSELDAVLPRGAFESLEVPLGALASAIALPLEVKRATVRSWFAECFGEGNPISALEVHRRFDVDRPHEQPPTPDTAALCKALERVRSAFVDAETSAVDGCGDVDLDALVEATRGTIAATRPGYLSADLMIGRDGRWVLGEVHGFYLLPTCLLDVASEQLRSRVLDEMRARLPQLSGGVPTAQAVLLHTQATDRSFPIADFDVEIVGMSGRPEAIRFADLTMELCAGEILFRVGPTEIAPFVQYSTYPFLLYTSKLAPLVDDFASPFFPDELYQPAAPVRLSLGPIVVRRATWSMEASRLKSLLGDSSGVHLLAAALELQTQLGCDRCVFVSIPGEPKPVFLDFANLFLLESLVRLLNRVEPSKLLRFVEMLPGPTDLFLEGSDGYRTFELRTGWVRS